MTLFGVVECDEVYLVAGHNVQPGKTGILIMNLNGGQLFITLLTLGAERPLQFRDKKTADFGQVLLCSGSLLVMQPDSHHLW